MDRLTRLLTNIGVLVGGIFLVGASLVITFEVFLRKFANTSIESLHEVSAFAMAITFAWAMPFTILTRGHIRVDLLYSRLSARARLATDIFAALALAAYLVVVVQHCAQLTISSWSAGTFSSGVIEVPLAIPQAIWTAGFLVAALVLVIALANAGYAFAKGRTAEAAATLAPYAQEPAAPVGLSERDAADAAQDPRH